MKYISINDLKLLVKKKFYLLETGSTNRDFLVYDRQAKTYVGHIEGANIDEVTGSVNEVQFFRQNEYYNPPKYILSELETFKNNTHWEDGLNW